MKLIRKQELATEFPEAFLHFIWQHQYLNPSGLVTTDGQRVVVHFPGWLNADAGPDFHQARIRIGDLEWNGSVEIHIRSSDFERHHHQKDPAYGNVVLHVVWQTDRQVFRQDGTPLPEVELRRVVDAGLVRRYASLMASGRVLPCSSILEMANPEIVKAMMNQAAAFRLEDWSKRVQSLHEKAGDDWQETAWQMLARAMGLWVNADAMHTLAGKLPFRVLARYRDRPHVVEALLFGTAGFLRQSPRDEYEERLKGEFSIIGKAHRLNSMSEVEWRFSRMRPAGFPTIRLAQLSAIVCSPNLALTEWMEFNAASDWTRLLRTEISDYWKNHLHFGKPGRLPDRMGEVWARIIRINAVAPLLVAYGHIHTSQVHIARAVELLECMPAEENRVIRVWSEAGIRASNAWESQGLIWKAAHHCRLRKCLECPIGYSGLRELHQPNTL